MTAFSRVEYNKKVIEKKVLRQKTLAKTGNPDEALKHVDEFRDAHESPPKYVILEKRVRKDSEKYQNTFNNRIEKRMGRKHD